MCLFDVEKCMGVEFGKIGSAPRVLGPSGTPKKARFWSSSNGENCSIYQIYDDKFKFIPPNPSE